jgi:hypothetical protein
MEVLSYVEDGEMARFSRHPRGVCERAVALVVETRSDYGSRWEAIVSVAEKVHHVEPGHRTGHGRLTHGTEDRSIRPNHAHT